MIEVGTLAPADVQFYTAHLVHAVSFLHSQGIVHRDLKPDNVLIKENGHLVIGDFGLAKSLAVAQMEKSASRVFKSLRNARHGVPLLRQTLTCCGTPCYIAPEVYARSWYGLAADVWALGIMHFEMMTNTVPFDGDLPVPEVARSVIEDKVAYVAKIWEEDASAKAFSEMLLNKDASTRPKASAVQAHVYLSEL